MRGGVFYLNNSRQLDDPFLDLTNQGIGVAEPGDVLRQQHRHDAARPLHRQAGRHDGAVLVRRPERQLQQAAAANLDASATRSAGRWRRTRFASAAKCAATSSTRICPRNRRRSSRSSTTSRMLLRGLATEGDTQFGITDKQFRFNDFNMFLSDDWRLSPIADAESRRALRVLRSAGGSQRAHRQRGLRGDHEHRESGERVHRPEERAEHRLRRDRRRDCDLGEGEQQPHAQGPGLEQRRAAAGICLDAESRRWVVRGGYGVFFDRPSAAFINTVFSNYPFLREQEVTFPASAVPLNGAWSQQDPTLPVQSVPAEPDRADRRRDRHVSDPGRHERDAGCGRHAESDRSGHGAADARQHRRDVRVPRHRPQPADAVHPAVQLRRPARARSEHDARSALRRQQGEQAARSARVQPGLRPQRRRHAGLHLRAIQPGLRRRRQPQRRTQRGRDRAGARRRQGVRIPEHQPRRHARLQPGQHRRRGHRLRGARPDPRLQHSRGRAARQHRPVALQLGPVQPR